MAVKSKQELKRQFVINELKALHVSISGTGKPLELLNYAELKEELVLASFRDIDVSNQENKWF